MARHIPAHKHTSMPPHHDLMPDPPLLDERRDLVALRARLEPHGARLFGGVAGRGEELLHHLQAERGRDDDADGRVGEVGEGGLA